MYNAADGAGNPRGIRRAKDYGYYETVGCAENGTGGLLICMAKDIINNGKILSNGSKGGYATASGGSSGGGSINIFYMNDYINNGEINSDGGLGVGSPSAGAGGTGSISVGQIVDGSYVSTYKNY